MLKSGNRPSSPSINLIFRVGPARPVPLYFPVRFVDGKVQRLVRLKQIAAAGGLGVNTLLLNRRFGSRLLLAGVVTGAPAQKTRRDDSDAPLCTGCGACIRACPEGALGPAGVDAFRCRNVRAWIPLPVAPAARGRPGGVTPIVPRVTGAAPIRYSLCATECPIFPGEEGRR